MMLPSPASAPGPDHAPFRLSAARLLQGGFHLGMGMVAVSFLWAQVVRRRDVYAWFPTGDWAGEIALGLLAGTVFSLLAWTVAPRIPPLKAILRLLAETLDLSTFRYPHALALGLVAGLPEEILFRGALQPDLKLAWTAILFGLLHAITPAYGLYATFAGGVLGALVLWRGDLWAAVAAHTAIDAVTFALLIRRWRRLHAAATTP